MYAQLRRGDADILLSGGRTQFVALKARTPWLDINQERHHAFAGYDGMVTLVRELDASLSNPVWADVRRLAPWEEEEGETDFDDEGVQALMPIA
jgi:nitrogenase molybdenum-cofactor synthesis protein NifE